MQTPGSIDQYSRFMVDMFDETQIIGVSTVWQSFFGITNGGARTVYSPDSDVVDIDIMRGNERVAALVERGTNGRTLSNKNTATQNYTSFSRTYPFAEEVGDISSTQINKRVAGENPYEQKDRAAGENPYEQKDRAARMRILAREHHLEHIRRYVRLFELLAGTALLSGQMPAILNTTNSDLIYDYRRNSSHFVSPAVPWDNASNDIEGDINTACNAIRVNAKTKANVMFMAQDVATAFYNDSKVKEAANNRRYTFVEAGTNQTCPPQMKALEDGGAVYRGYIQTKAGWTLQIFTYLDVYEDGNGDSKDYMPSGTVLIGKFGARCDRYFGPPERLPITSLEQIWYNEMFGMNIMAPQMPANIMNQSATINPNMFYCDAYKSGDNKKVSIRTQAAPIFATTQTDAFYTLTDVLEVTS